MNKHEYEELRINSQETQERIRKYNELQEQLDCAYNCLNAMKGRQRVTIECSGWQNKVIICNSEQKARVKGMVMLEINLIKKKMEEL